VPARVAAVNVVHALIPDVLGDLDRTAIDKRPVDGPVRVGRLGLEGDSQYDTRHHGGEEQAVYAYAVEDQQWWGRELGRELSPGRFGENLTVEGVDVTEAVVGETWRIGGSHEDAVVLQVTSPRVPCTTFQGFMGEPHWVKRFTEHGAPGAYLRVLQEGTLRAGDPVEVLDRPAHGVTIAEVFRPRVLSTPARMQTLLDHPTTQPKMARHAQQVLVAMRKAPQPAGS
jgi:MOSC domain-containing protein YiiM